MAETLTPITLAHVGIDAYGNVVYIVNGKKVPREDFNAVSLTRIAFALDQLVHVTAAGLEVGQDEEGAEPEAPTAENIFGAP